MLLQSPTDFSFLLSYQRAAVAPRCVACRSRETPIPRLTSRDLHIQRLKKKDVRHKGV